MLYSAKTLLYSFFRRSIFAEPLLHKGRTFTTNQVKANAFIKEYATVNRIRFNKRERNQIRQMKSTLKSPTAGESFCAALRMEELDEATLQMCDKDAAGPDNSPPPPELFPSDRTSS